MKTKLITGLALAVALLIGQPAFAHGKHGGGGGHRSHAVAAVHRSGGGGGGQHFRMASAHTRTAAAFRGSRVANVKRGAGRNFAATSHTRGVRTNRQTFALGGSAYRNNNGQAGGGHGSYAFASHSGWNQDREYNWRGHHYRWYGDGWYMIDALSLYPYAAAYPYSYGPGYNTDSMAVQVQQDLAHDGYYQGPIDGVIGPGTSNAIAAYQQDNGLPVTGSINGPLLRSMGL